VCQSIMACNPAPYLVAVEETAADILQQAAERGTSTVVIAREISQARIAAARTGGHAS
jgi:hypothetical protein